MTSNYQNKIAQSRAAHVSLLKDSFRRVVETLSALDQVERVSLFGSYARGKMDRLTDLDAPVIMRTEQPFVERLKSLYSLLTLPVDLDLLCIPTESQLSPTRAVLCRFKFIRTQFARRRSTGNTVPFKVLARSTG